MQELFEIDKDFKPCPVDDGDEFFANGIFELNISKMNEYIHNKPDIFTPEIVVIKDIYSTSPHINETHLDSVDVPKPVILAEIAPDWNDNIKEQAGTLSKDTLYQILITLLGFTPIIWRMVQVKPEMPLAYFHRLIQNVMGCQDIHLHHFIKGDTFYSPKLDENDGWGTIKQVDYKDLTIRDILTKQNDHLIFEYDFGNCWQHEIHLEKIVPTGKKEHPICLNGMMRCPPEDSGGIWGYMDMLEELNKLDRAELKLYLEDRFMDDFDPDHFDKDAINQQLKEWEAIWLNKWK